MNTNNNSAGGEVELASTSSVARTDFGRLLIVLLSKPAKTA